MKVALHLNGAQTEIEVRADESLLDALRARDLRGCRLTCGIGLCGACTVLLDGQPVATCLLLAPLAEGRAVTTIEGLEGDDALQHAFVEYSAFQYGYCTPGMILTARALLDETPHPTDEEIRHALAGNLCRCGCYPKIVSAVRSAATASERGRREPDP